MRSTGLFLDKGKLFAGMIVAITLASKEEPEVDEKGEPLLLHVLISTFGPSYRLYPFPGGIRIMPGEGTSHTGHPNPPFQASSGFRLADIHKDVRFMPIQVFTPTEAPNETKFVVFVDSQPLKYENSRHWVHLEKKDGRLVSINGYQYGWWQREYPLSENAKLVPLYGTTSLDGLMATAETLTASGT